MFTDELGCLTNSVEFKLVIDFTKQKMPMILL